MKTKLYFTPEDVEKALKELGPPGTRAESIVKSAALAAVDVMRGGKIEVVNLRNPAEDPDLPSPGYIDTGSNQGGYGSE